MDQITLNITQNVEEVTVSVTESNDNVALAVTENVTSVSVSIAQDARPATVVLNGGETISDTVLPGSVASVSVQDDDDAEVGAVDEDGIVRVSAGSLLENADLTVTENKTALAGNATLVPNVTDLIVPNSTNISAMAAKVDAYLTRISASNTALEAKLHERMMYIARDPVAYSQFVDCPFYLMWPDSKAQGIYPLFPLTGSSVAEDRLQEYGAGCTYDSALGVGANGTDSTWYMGVPMARLACVGYAFRYCAYIQISQPATANTYMGAYQHTGLTAFRNEGGISSTGYLYFGNIVLRWDISQANNHLVEIISDDTDRADNVHYSRVYDQGDYDTPHDTHSSTGTSNNLTFSDTYLFLLHARVSLPFPANAPHAFGDQKISAFAFWKGGTHAANKVIAEQLDQWKIDKSA